ncbi:ABC transporter permease [Streptomyces sp. NPDC059818]|uniref:ABC transporter permease n=1 Tax=Streptomyces sp. NPDC059818 TaxID=3346962 RepID=UPI003661C125
MTLYLIRRLAAGAVMVLSVSLATFTLLFAGGGDIARNLLGENATNAQVAEKAAELGLDRPVVVQYLDWLGGALRGDFGVSWFSGETVTGALGTRAEVTLSLVAGAIVLSALAAVALGVWAAVRGGWVDRALQAVSLLGIALPGFLIALLLVTVFALQLGWLPATGFVMFQDSPGDWLRSVVLPVIALGIGSTVNLTQQIRGAVLDGLDQEWVRTLRARGLPQRRIVLRHVLPGAAGPALAVLGLQLVGLIGGAVVIEQVFAIPGIGQLAVNASVQGDIPAVMGLVVSTAVAVVVVNLLVDLAQYTLNPKLRLS